MRNSKNHSSILFYMLFVSVAWLWLYLILYYRYAPLYSDYLIFKRLREPFFSLQYFGSDFYGPMQFSKTLAPYEPKYGNSPPLLMILSWFFSVLESEGISWQISLLFTWTCAIVALGWSVYKSGRINQWNGAACLRIASVLLLSFPCIYCFDRGNLVFLVSALIALAFVAEMEEHSCLSAIMIGLAASLKLYPAILGICFLAKKEWKAAFVCLLTGVLSSCLPLFFFQEGFIHNLRLFLEKATSYAAVGNGKMEWLVDDKNSFYQLLLIPKMLGSHPLTDIEALNHYISGFRFVVLGFSVAAIAISVLFESNANRLLLLTMIMLGFPIESGAYNLILVLFPIAYWCFDRTIQHSRIIMLLCVLLITMKSFIAIAASSVAITPQAILNPVLEVLIIIMLIWAERKPILSKLSKRKISPV